MKSRSKVFEHTASKISCSKCGDKLNKLHSATHNSKAMYKVGDADYLCASTKCTKDYLAEKFDRYENEGRNYTDSEAREIKFLKESNGAGDWLLKEKYGIE